MTALRKFRKGYGYQQRTFAALVNITPSYMCKLELGDRKPSSALARIIAKVFGAKAEAVFPDGVAEKDCLKKFDRPPIYVPEELERPVVKYPPSFRVACYKCGAWICLKADDYHPILDDTLRCPACGAGFGVRPPEETHV